MKTQEVPIKEAKATANASGWLAAIVHGELIPFLAEKGIKVPDVKVLLSFPTSGGEAVEPPTDKEGAVNPRAGEARKRFQFLPALLTDKGQVLAADKANPDTMALTKGARVAAEVPTLLITPAKHAPWNGSAFGHGDKAELAERIIAALHGLIFSSVVTFPPSDAKRTSKGNIKVYKGHFEALAEKVGLMGKGWSVQPTLMEFTNGVMERNPAPDGAAIILNPPDGSAEKTSESVRLKAADGTVITISARSVRSKKQAKDGKMCALEVLQTKGPFTFVGFGKEKGKSEAS